MDRARADLLDLLRRYLAQWPHEAAVVARLRALVTAHADCLQRTCVPGHVTASALVLHPRTGHVLLHHHRKLDRWLQLGGHADGDPDPLAVAMREVREESGLRTLRPIRCDGRPPSVPVIPVDVDVHWIPAHGDEPGHEHHDLRYLLLAADGEPLARSAESLALAWMPLAEARARAGEDSLARLCDKARAAAAAVSTRPAW